jgi:hypothetical protein
MTAFHTLGASLHPQEGIEKYCTCLSFYHWFVAVTIMHIHANNIIYQCCFYNLKLLDKVEIGKSIYIYIYFNSLYSRKNIKAFCGVILRNLR